jgi:hypothetical protein
MTLLDGVTRETGSTGAILSADASIWAQDRLPGEGCLDTKPSNAGVENSPPATGFPPGHERMRDQRIPGARARACRCVPNDLSVSCAFDVKIRVRRAHLLKLAVGQNQLEDQPGGDLRNGQTCAHVRFLLRFRIADALRERRSRDAQPRGLRPEITPLRRTVRGHNPDTRSRRRESPHPCGRSPRRGDDCRPSSDREEGR